MMTYAHHRAPDLHIPHRDAVKRRILRMSKETIGSTKQFFAVRHFDCSRGATSTLIWITGFNRLRFQVKLVSLWMLGRRVIIMHFLPLWLITWRRRDTWVRASFSKLYPCLTNQITDRGVTHRLPGNFGRAFWWEYGWCCLDYSMCIWNWEPRM